ALWLGSAFFLMLAASAAFRSSPNSTVAADVVGAMLSRWHYIALAAPLALFALELRHARKMVLVVLFTAIVLAAAQAFVDLRIRAIRNASVVPISELAKEDPVRRQFGALHGISMLLLLLQAISAGVVVAWPELRHRDRVPVDVDLVHRQPEGPERVADLAGVADDHDQ
ncbi:MAG TPA: hypothetical protein VEU30_08310, partial [Thermoanaerobaculia bacterium]|nr:hypothetical protein [Thermoanaerobaculia bacterium]